MRVPPGSIVAAVPPNVSSTEAGVDDMVTASAPLVKEYANGLNLIVLPPNDNVPVAITLPEMATAGGLVMELLPVTKLEYTCALVVMPGIAIGVSAAVLTMSPLLIE